MSDTASLPLRAEAETLAGRFPPLLIEAARIAATVAAGAHGRRKPGVGETFWQHRPYADGDPVAGIDWRQSARAADRLYVRENEWETAATVWIWRDPSASLDYASSRNLPTKRRRAEVAALALCALLVRGGERIGALGAGGAPISGRGATARFLERMLLQTDSASLPPRMRLPRGARVVFLSDFYTDPDALAACVRAYAATGAQGHLVQVVDPAEEDFPFTGRTEFLDTESDARLLFGNAGAARDTYRTRFAAHRDSLIALARRYGWTFAAHRTDRAPERLLLGLHMALSGARA